MFSVRVCWEALASETFSLVHGTSGRSKVKSVAWIGVAIGCGSVWPLGVDLRDSRVNPVMLWYDVKGGRIQGAYQISVDGSDAS